MLFFAGHILMIESRGLWGAWAPIGAAEIDRTDAMVVA